MAEDFYAKYGLQIALVNSDPSLKALFDKAVKGNWDANKFRAEFMNTEWYKTHSDTWRTAESAKLTDPASWAEQLQLAKDLVRREAVKMGFIIDQAQIDQLAEQSLYLAAGSAGRIDTTTLATHITELGKIGVGGSVQAATDQLKQLAYSMGLTYTDSYYQDAAKSVLAGTADISMFEQQIRDVAKSQFPQFAAQIDAGLSVSQIASPYINTMASILELDPYSIQMSDPTVKQALNGISADGTPAPMSLWDFEKSLRQDPRWQYTKNARDAADNTARKILQDFGLAW